LHKSTSYAKIAPPVFAQVTLLPNP